MTRFLITTALEETWPDDSPVLFLGEWCRRYSRKERWSRMDAEVLPYHWDDRSRLHADYRYLKEFHERLLGELTERLNELHGGDHGSRYWRIVIGPWLGYFTQMLFDRWTSVQQALREHEVCGTVVLTGEDESLVPRDMGDFTRLFVGDEWNHHLYSSVLRLTNVPRIERQRPVTPPNAPAPSRSPGTVTRTIANWYRAAAAAVSRDQDALLLATSLPYKNELQVQLRLGQVPQLWRTPSPVPAPVDSDRRRWTLNGDNLSEFEACARSLIPGQMPTAYLEGHKQLVEQAAQLPWPRQPRVIWTSGLHNSNEVFKVWAADKVERGSALVIGQHGGHYGVGRWSFLEDHEIAIGDRYLSWGWSSAETPTVRPIGQLKSKRPLGVRHAEQARALLVTHTMPRQSYLMYSAVVSRQWLDYFEDQASFVAQLPLAIQDALTVRLYSSDYGWDQVARWRDRFPALTLDVGRASMDDLIGQSRLYISTYNATTYLESFTMNVPTVIFWNPEHWELRDSAVPYFAELQQAGIFHDTPQSAAAHVAAIWNDVEAWWNGSTVQAARQRFTTQYCLPPDDLVTRAAHAVREAAASVVPRA